MNIPPLHPLFLFLSLVLLIDIVSDWLARIRDATIDTWNHPSLLHPQECWKVNQIITLNYNIETFIFL